MITWRRLGFHERPMVLANHRGCWNPLLPLFDHNVPTGFAQTDSHDLYAVADSVDGIFERLTVGCRTSSPRDGVAAWNDRRLGTVRPGPPKSPS